MLMKNSKKKIWHGWIICLLMLCLTGCNERQNKKDTGKTEGVSWFAPYTQSLGIGANEFDLLFYCDKADKSVWAKENIGDVLIRIGTDTTEMSVKSIELTDDGEYYRGTIKLTGTFSNECWGDMYLLVSEKDKEEQQKYELGECYVIDNRETDFTDISRLQCSGVLKTDEKENIFTYGVILNIETECEITIRKIDLALYRTGLDTDHYIIFSPQEYKSKVEGCVEETRFNEIFKDAYIKKTADRLNNTIELDLKKGEYYIYFPLVFEEENIPGLIQSVVKLEYTDGKPGNGNISFVSDCFPYFTEPKKSEQTVKAVLSA